MPVYKWGMTKGISTDEAAKLLLQQCVDRTYISTHIPTNISKNTVFLVDTSNLLDVADVKCDDLGAWQCTGCPKFYYSTDQDGNFHKHEDPEDCPANQVLYIIQRQYFTNKSLPSLRKSLISARLAASTMPQSLIIVQYIFGDGEQVVKVKSHGNSKGVGSRSFKRTMKSTRDSMKGKLKGLPPRQVVHAIVEQKGGIMKIESAGDIPRNRTQVYNLNRELKRQNVDSPITTGDPLLQVLVKAKEEQQGRKEDMLIREIPLFPEPIIFLATEQQLIDIERFCSNPEKFCILGVDCTFQIADFYYTFTTYRNLMLATEKGHHPVLIGPGILHKQKLLSSYKTLPLLMTKYRKETSGVLVFGTDGEENLYNAMAEVFVNAKHLRCDIHLRDNVKRKLGELLITGAEATEIMFDIFGKGMGDVTEGGLVDCRSPEEFEVGIRNATKRWQNLHKNGEKFCSYFLKEKADVIRQCCTADIRSMCGLGFPPKVYTQNASESMNRLVKANDSSVTGLPASIEHIRREVNRQYNEQFLAVINRGEYKLTDAFSHLGVEEQDFFRMSDQQKKALKKKFFSVSMSDVRKDLKQQERSSNTENSLSIAPEKAQIIAIPFPVLKGMFAKAATLVKDGSAVWKVPNTRGEATIRFMVHSTSSRDPHQVQVNVATGKVQCDKVCVNWTTYSMCSHTLAGAEAAGSLKEFLHWFRGRKRSPSISAISNLNMPKNAGQKVGTRKRKGTSNKPSTEGRPIVCSRVLQPINCVASTNVSANPVVPGHSPEWQYDDSIQLQPNLGMGVSENPPVLYNYPCTQTTGHTLTCLPGQSIESTENMQVNYPERPKPAPGIFAFGILSFLDSKVSRCYGCGQTLKPGGLISLAPDDLVLTTRLQRKYYKDGRQHISPDISSVYCHVNPYCVTTAFPGFQPSLCQVPSDLLPFLLPEHKEMVVNRLGVFF